MTLDLFLSHFSHVKKNSNGWQVCCPAHEDTKASLSITIKGNKILLYCHAGCSNEAILEAIGLKLKDLFLESKLQPQKPEIVAIYEYTDENEKLLFQTVRFNPKDFRQRRPDGKGKWLWNLKGVALVPYRLPAILKEPSIFIVEGEKDADNLWKLGLPATCNPMGAGKWLVEWSKYFEGKEIFIVPDLDEPGQKHAVDVGKKLFGHALRIKIIELPKLANVKDISDWFNHGGDKVELLKLTKETKEWLPPGTKPPKPVLKTITAADLEEMVFPEPKWAIPSLLPEGLTILAGRPKRGKSWMALGIALTVASGGKALGKLDVEKGDALYLALEDNPRRLQNRLAILKDPETKLPSRLHLVTDFLPLQLGGMQSLLIWLDKHPKTHLVVIDTLGRILPSGKGNNNQFVDDYQFIGKLQKLSIDRGFALLVIHHIRKQSADYALDRVAGTTGITGAADSVWVLDSGKGEANAILHVTGRDIETQEIAMKFEDGIWTVIGDAKDVAMSQERKLIMDLLKTEGALYPKEIADLLNKPHGGIRYLLFAMKKEGQVSNNEKGQYVLPA
ncbi:MAG: AAA family ATPase [Candidatus Riflebacteria bacterium]|nr:AAA family ATPase [Candidatus Riflebacteria bacterium]